MMRLYLDGKEVDPAEYSFAPLVGPAGAGVVTLTKPMPPGSFTLSFEPDFGDDEERTWKYGDLLDLRADDGAVVMYVRYAGGTVNKVIDLMNGDIIDALDSELALIEPPSMLAP